MNKQVLAVISLTMLQETIKCTSKHITFCIPLNWNQQLRHISHSKKVLIQCIYLLLDQKDLRTFFLLKTIYLSWLKLIEILDCLRVGCGGSDSGRYRQKKQVSSSVDLVKLEKMSKRASFETLSFEFKLVCFKSKYLFPNLKLNLVLSQNQDSNNVPVQGWNSCRGRGVAV